MKKIVSDAYGYISAPIKKTLENQDDLGKFDLYLFDKREILLNKGLFAKISRPCFTDF